MYNSIISSTFIDLSTITILLLFNPIMSLCIFYLVLNSSQMLCGRQINQVARASKTKYHRLSGLNNITFLSHSSGGQKAKIKVSSGLVSSDTSLLGLQILLPLSSHGLFTWIPGEFLCSQISSSYKDTSWIALGSTLMGLF